MRVQLHDPDSSFRRRFFRALGVSNWRHGITWPRRIEQQLANFFQLAGLMSKRIGLLLIRPFDLPRSAKQRKIRAALGWIGRWPSVDFVS